ncbi:hypothetical protein BACCOPRO_02678 [Phocaeicola coprophilus DSM 18228 = JCM 13818]|uniref:Uncharacterized protein n=1 Tax=Phocaeicola coprophilus DSM 18228 = JCM 13818 TaxID=547042 RepID=S0FE76_9BACT|nr:hypothetical protein BACCOPRO_02678 [Phocaeicola coprophilus DSM 18228 = JCM 13818]
MTGLFLSSVSGILFDENRAASFQSSSFLPLFLPVSRKDSTIFSA